MQVKSHQDRNNAIWVASAVLLLPWVVTYAAPASRRYNRDYHAGCKSKSMKNIEKITKMMKNKIKCLFVLKIILFNN